MTILVVSLLLADLLAFVVCVLKGKPWFAALGLLFGWFSLVGALRRAKPDSWWAHTYYGPHEMEAAMRRFPRSADQLEAWSR